MRLLQFLTLALTGLILALAIRVPDASAALLDLLGGG